MFHEFSFNYDQHDDKDETHSCLVTVLATENVSGMFCLLKANCYFRSQILEEIIRLNVTKC